MGSAPLVGLVVPAADGWRLGQLPGYIESLRRVEPAAMTAQERSIMSNLRHKRFRFPEDGGYDAQSVVIRQTDGEDEKDAAKRLDMMPAGSSSMYSELVRLAIVLVNDEPVDQPFLEFNTWKSISRDLVMSAFNALNENDEAAKAAFLSASEDVAPLVTRARPRTTMAGGTPSPTTSE